jgi:hypothetical protein
MEDVMTKRYVLLRVAVAAVSLLLASCCPLPPGQLGEEPVLNGKAEEWVGRALTIKLELRRDIGATHTFEVLGNGTVDAAGNFTIKLPGLSAMAPFLVTASNFFSGCSNVDIVPSDVRDCYAPRLAVFDGSNLIGRIFLKPDNVGSFPPRQVLVVLIFFDKATDFDVTCTDAEGTDHEHFTAGLGWNIGVSELYGPNLVHTYIGAMPKESRWVYVPGP